MSAMRGACDTRCTNMVCPSTVMQRPPGSPLASKSARAVLAVVRYRQAAYKKQGEREKGGGGGRCHGSSGQEQGESARMVMLPHAAMRLFVSVCTEVGQ